MVLFCVQIVCCVSWRFRGCFWYFMVLFKSFEACFFTTRNKRRPKRRRGWPNSKPKHLPGTSGSREEGKGRSTRITPRSASRCQVLLTAAPPLRCTPCSRLAGVFSCPALNCRRYTACISAGAHLTSATVIRWVMFAQFVPSTYVDIFIVQHCCCCLCTTNTRKNVPK